MASGPLRRHRVDRSTPIGSFWPSAARGRISGVFIPRGIAVEAIRFDPHRCIVLSLSRLPTGVDGLVCFALTETLSVSVRVHVRGRHRRVAGGRRSYETELVPHADAESRDAFQVLRRIAAERAGRAGAATLR